jgi:hypothetical protein
MLKYTYYELFTPMDGWQNIELEVLLDERMVLVNEIILTYFLQCQFAINKPNIGSNILKCRFVGKNTKMLMRNTFNL